MKISLTYFTRKSIFLLSRKQNLGAADHVVTLEIKDGTLPDQDLTALGDSVKIPVSKEKMSLAKSSLKPRSTFSLIRNVKNPRPKTLVRI